MVRKVRTYWISLFFDKNADVYFDSLGIDHIPEEILNKIKDKSIRHNILNIIMIP